MSNSREFLLSNCVSVRISFGYICPLRLSFFVSFFSFYLSCVECLCLSVVYLKCTCFLRSIIFVSDRLTFTLITTIFVFRLDEPVRQSRVRWVPYHCYISVAISLKNIGQKFCLLGESILKTRLFPLWYFRNYSKLLLICVIIHGECVHLASFESPMESRHEDC